MAEFDPRWYTDPKLHSQDYFLLFRPPEAEATIQPLLEFLSLQPGAKVLDLACGWGRIAIPLAKRGFDVTGIDLSEHFLATAQASAKEAGVNLRLIHSDMREIPFEAEFDAVIIMGGSFGQLESDEEHERVVQAVRRALKPGGRFILDLVNPEWIIRNYLERDWSEPRPGTFVLTERQLSLNERRNYVRMIIVEPDGSRREHNHILRFYTLVELRKMMENAGLTFRQAWGDWSGGDYTLDSRWMIVLAAKEG